MAVGAQTTPRVVTVAPPLAVTLPPKVAVVAVILAEVGVVTVGDVAAAVVKLPVILYPVPWMLVAYAAKG